MDVRLAGIRKSYDGRAILDGVDLEIPSGGVVVLEGANGTGKTTLMECVVGLVQPDEGDVLVGGKSALALKPYERGVFYVPQNVHKFWSLTEHPLFCYLPSVSVRENLEEAARRDEEKAEEFLRLFGLFAVRASNPAELSRGQKQRLALARAFLSQQPIVMLDEPLASIDPSSRQDLIETLDFLQRRYARTLLYVTQHPEELRHVKAERISIRSGRLAPGYEAAGSLTARVARRAARELLTALAVDGGDRLEAAAVAGRTPSEVLEWAAERLRERKARAEARGDSPSVFRKAVTLARNLRERLGSERKTSLLQAEISALRREMSVLRAAVQEIQGPGLADAEIDAALRPRVDELARRIDEVRGMVSGDAAPAPSPAGESKDGGNGSSPKRPPEASAPEPRRIMRRRQAPWISEPLAESVWRPGQPKKEEEKEATAASPKKKKLPRKKTKKAASKRRTLILRAPSMMYNYHGIPPFGTATIVAELRGHGHHVEQDDLDAKCAHIELFPRHRWGKQYPAKELVMDIVRMRKHWEGKDDPDVIDLVETVLGLTDVAPFDTIAISCIEGDDYSAVLTLCMGKYLRDKLGKTVILGGEAFPHMQPIKSEVAYFYEQGCFDHYIQGYGEVPLLELFRRLDEGEPVADTPGLVSVDAEGEVRENRPLFTRPEVIPDFDGLPMELYYKKPDDWDIWKHEDEGVEELLVLPIKTNYCCPNKCAFCISSGDTFTKVSWLSPEQIVRAIRTLKEKYDTPYFMFADDMFNVGAKWTEEVADALIEADLNIFWSDCAFARDMSPELLQKLRRSGAVRLVWGMETASPRLQKMINKNLDMDYLADVLRWSHEAGIYNALQVIAGLPTETDEDIEATVEFLRRNQPHIDQVYLNPFSLITGSLMHRFPDRYGIKNVHPVSTIFQIKPDEVYSWIQRYTFDTDGDLPWKEKVRQIENSFRRLQETMIDLDLGGHDIHTLMLRFARYGDKRFVKDFQSARKHQGFDYFGDAGERGHSPTGAHI